MLRSGRHQHVETDRQMDCFVIDLLFDNYTHGWGGVGYYVKELLRNGHEGDRHAQRECLGRLFAENRLQCALDAMRTHKYFNTSTRTCAPCWYVAKINNIFGCWSRRTNLFHAIE